MILAVLSPASCLRPFFDPSSSLLRLLFVTSSSLPRPLHDPYSLILHVFVQFCTFFRCSSSINYAFGLSSSLFRPFYGFIRALCGLFFNRVHELRSPWRDLRFFLPFIALLNVFCVTCSVIFVLYVGLRPFCAPGSNLLRSFFVNNSSPGRPRRTHYPFQNLVVANY